MAHIPPPWHPRSRQQRGAIFRNSLRGCIYTLMKNRTIPKCVNLLDQRFVPFARKCVCAHAGSVTRCLVSYGWNLQFIARLNQLLFINRRDALPGLCIHPLHSQHRRARGAAQTLAWALCHALHTQTPSTTRHRRDALKGTVSIFQSVA